MLKCARHTGCKITRTALCSGSYLAIASVRALGGPSVVLKLFIVAWRVSSGPSGMGWSASSCRGGRAGPHSGAVQKLNAGRACGAAWTRLEAGLAVEGASKWVSAGNVEATCIQRQHATHREVVPSDEAAVLPGHLRVAADTRNQRSQ